MHPASEREDQSYRERLPGPAIVAAVSCGWLLEVRNGAVYEHRTVPNGCAEIVCDLRTGRLRVTGPRHGPILERLPAGARVIGLRFRPGAAWPLLGVPTPELVDRTVELDDIWGATTAELGERILDAATPSAALSLLEHAVAGRMSGPRSPDPLVAAAVERLQPWRRRQVGAVSADLFLSPRQLDRRFRAALGFGPKTLQRILRFQGFLALANSVTTSNSPLARLAALAGYADQAHLSRECHRLTGLTPRAFLETVREMCAPTHDHAASFGPLQQSLLGGRTT